MNAAIEYDDIVLSSNIFRPVSRKICAVLAPTPLLLRTSVIELHSLSICTSVVKHIRLFLFTKKAIICEVYK